MSGPLNATFTYDAEGRRVIGVVSGTETIYLGDWYERTGGSDISYYHFNGRRVARRTSAGVSYLYADHLAIEHLRNGTFDGEAMVTHQLPLDQFAQGLEIVHRGDESIKVELRP